tara:strand:- start:188 stop:1408 length:1221 start_codon:yes stop_codon:yes gene_type:complete
MTHHRIAILGAGLAGLATAYHLESQNIDYILIEQKNYIGGRQQTIKIDSFLCDVGFQILLSAYTQLNQFPLNNLENCYFPSGAKCYINNAFHKLANPLKHPFNLLNSLFNPAATMTDYIRLSKHILKLLSISQEDIFSEPNISTTELFKSLNLSQSFITNFLNPFFKGIFLEPNLNTSARLCNYYLKLFVTGDAIVPKKGICALPELIASYIPTKKIQLNTKVESVKNSIITTTQDIFKADYICCALDNHSASHLFNIPKLSHNQVKNIYFSSKEATINSKWLHLVDTGPINNFHSVTALNKEASPQDTYLYSISSIPTKNEPMSSLEILNHAKLLLGNSVDTWKEVIEFNIKHALINQKVSYNQLNSSFNKENIYFCGDWTIQASTNGALYSGRKVANLILNQLT